MKSDSGLYRQGVSLTIGVLLFVLILYTMEKTGVPRQYSIALTCLFAVAVFVIGVFPAGTTRAGQFLSNNREAGTDVSSLALASLIAFPFVIIQSGAVFFLQPGFLLVLCLASTAGLAMAGLLSFRQFNSTHASDISEMLYARFGSTIPPRFFAATNALSGLLLTACGMSGGIFLISWFFATSALSAVLFFSLCIFLSGALGGAATITRFGAVATMLALLGFNLPLLVHSVSENGFPIGQLTFGYSALEPGWELEQRLTSLGIPSLSQQVSATTAILNWSTGIQILFGLVLMTAVASLPSLVQSGASNIDDETAGRTIRRSVLISGLLVASIFALMAFTKIGFYQSMLGLTLTEARVEVPMIHNWGGRHVEFVKLCGNVVENADDVLSACPGGADYIINIPDIELESRLLLVGAAELGALPFAFTALLFVAITAVLISFTSATLLATCNNLVSAFYATRPGKVTSGRVFMTRAALLAMIAAVIWTMTHFLEDYGRVFAFAISLGTAVTAPVLFGVFFLSRCSAAAVSSAILVGFSICVLYYVLNTYGIDLAAGTDDEVRIRFPGMREAVPGELGAVFALPLALITLVIVSVLSDLGSNQAEDLKQDPA